MATGMSLVISVRHQGRSLGSGIGGRIIPRHLLNQRRLGLLKTTEVRRQRTAQPNSAVGERLGLIPDRAWAEGRGAVHRN